MCGIVGVVARSPANQLLYDGLLVLQHRGQDAAGIVTADGSHFQMHKGGGLVRDVFRTRDMRNLVGTMGMLSVPNGSVNVVPGKCSFSLDIRATTNAVRDACVNDVQARLQEICTRRGLGFKLEESLRASAAPSDPTWQARWETAVDAIGLPVHRMPSGAGHDAMKLHERMPQAMLFVRGLNAGISHNPRESITADDAELSVRAFQQLLDQLS